MAENSTFEDLLDYLRDHRGFDFTGYKRNTLSRRIEKRMDEVGVSEGDYPTYIDFLEVHPDEFPELFNTILINVTSFFRDGDAWAHLQSETLPAVLTERERGEPIRIWSAGCSAGHEAYTLAMVLAELLGVEEFSRRVKIYATDIDEDALLTARNGVYDRRELEPVAPELLDRYFEPVGSQYRFANELRRNLIFGRHDITMDAPISNLDLLVCRNTLMYFNAEAQGRVLPRFHYALRDDGTLFLGRAEMLLTHTDLFRPADMTNRMFQKVGSSGRFVPDGRPRRRGGFGGAADAGIVSSAYDAGHVAEVVIDPEGQLLVANALARSGFGITNDDLGRPLRDLEVSYRPVELRSRIEQAYAENRTIQVRNVERNFPQGDPQFLDVLLSPLSGPDNRPIGMSIKFVDVTRFTLLQMDLKRSNEELETAYEELQSTNEELETTNEELQSTVEELETTNEELQSTNEELETMNEELQSTNEELETMNVELRVRTESLDRSNRFHDALLAALSDGVIAVDGTQRIALWSDASAELWGLDATEAVDVRLADLDIGLPTDEIAGRASAVLSGQHDEVVVEVEAVNRRGKALETSTTIRPIYRNRPHDGVILITAVRER